MRHIQYQGETLPLFPLVLVFRLVLHNFYIHLKVKSIPPLPPGLCAEILSVAARIVARYEMSRCEIFGTKCRGTKNTAAENLTHTNISMGCFLQRLCTIPRYTPTIGLPT